MEVITIESEAFQQLVSQLEEIRTKLSEEQKRQPLSEVWLDNHDVCKLLHISKRTLQHYRDKKLLEYSQVGAKIFYKASEIERFLNEHHVSS